MTHCLNNLNIYKAIHLSVVFLSSTTHLINSYICLPFRSDTQWRQWTQSPWRRTFWKCCTAVCRDRWLVPGEIVADIYASNSESSETRDIFIHPIKLIWQFITLQSKLEFVINFVTTRKSLANPLRFCRAGRHRQTYTQTTQVDWYMPLSLVGEQRHKKSGPW